MRFSGFSDDTMKNFSTILAVLSFCLTELSLRLRAHEIVSYISLFVKNVTSDAFSTTTVSNIDMQQGLF